MTAPTDHELLAEFARSQSEEAFATLVTRHINLVYSAALRSTGNPHHAQEITQAAFIILARKAGKLSPRIVLSGWLYQTARLTAANFMKGERRRQRREQESYMQSTLNEPDAAAWQQIAPLLDDAMGGLGEADRNTVVLRFFENKTAAEMAATLKISEAAAHKRLTRALEKLRKIFRKRGVALSTLAIAGAVSTNSVQAAPVELTQTISAIVAAKGTAAASSTVALVKGALKLMAWTKAKTVIVVGAGLLLTAGTATVAVITVTHSEIDAYLKDPDLKTYLNAPPMIVLQKTHFPDYVSSPGGRQDGDKMIGRNLPLQFVISDAYATAMVRMVLPSDLPTQRYDYMDTITNRPREAFQALIRRKLGWTGRPELRDMDVLLLRIKMPEGPKLKVSPKNQLRNSAPGKFLDWPNQPVASLASFVEGCFQKPVVDQTGLTNFYDITIEGTWQPSAQANQDFLETALPKQLGLELVPTNMPIEILVVERAK